MKKRFALAVIATAAMALSLGEKMGTVPKLRS